MTGSSVIADTNIFIEIMQGDEHLAGKLEAIATVYLSPTVFAELLFGAWRSANPQKNLAKILLVTKNTKPVAIDLSTSEAFVKIKLALLAKGKPIPENDIWIAALGIQYGISIFTNDSHFSEVDGLNLLQ